ncbi:hypothetical protein HYH03_000837 [Edaphochlamys debaryana]|uniref:Uncharacterized protein n=1 Tax=Edaphochlamys debaryana TaxID=47281 RepID=A0A835YDN7_9CHLO|nr:hypothetical protein HYH03_000837 [Edaphochlamys debaryana]|eukprot:KAG2501017.1 hypothetical protein HYH03_000837 [Edaphochlamys debaryana]
MAQHTYCRGKTLRQEPCSHSDALAIVKDLIDGGISRLPDDVRANLHSLEAQLRVLEKFPADVSPGGGDIAPAAGAAAKADKEKKKDKHKKKEKESGDKSAKEKADTAGADATAGKKAKRRAEEEAGEEAGKKKKKSKKDGAGGA